MKRASEGIAQLIERTCGPRVEATVTVDQVYAHYQHEGLEFKHPRGGRAKYLELPLFEHRDQWLGTFAAKFLRARENVARMWAAPGRSLVAQVAREAPLEFGDLRQSAGLKVTEGGVVVVEEPPIQRRLTEDEIRLKRGFLRGEV